MNELTVAEKYAYFVDTLDHCGRFLLDASCEEIGYHLFEEFDGDARAFLCEANLDELTAAGYISREMAQSARLLRERFSQLENTPLWCAQAVKSALEWLEILALADHMKSEVP